MDYNACTSLQGLNEKPFAASEAGFDDVAVTKLEHLLNREMEKRDVLLEMQKQDIEFPSSSSNEAEEAAPAEVEMIEPQEMLASIVERNQARESHSLDPSHVERERSEFSETSLLEVELYREKYGCERIEAATGSMLTRCRFARGTELEAFFYVMDPLEHREQQILNSRFLELLNVICVR